MKRSQKNITRLKWGVLALCIFGISIPLVGTGYPGDDPLPSAKTVLFCNYDIAGSVGSGDGLNCETDRPGPDWVIEAAEELLIADGHNYNQLAGRININYSDAVTNFAALIKRNGHGGLYGCILLNNTFLDTIENTNPQYIYPILAHEIAHSFLINTLGKTLDDTSEPNELECLADFYAGKSMFHLRKPCEDGVDALNRLVNDSESRISAFEAGYNHEYSKFLALLVELESTPGCYPKWFSQLSPCRTMDSTSYTSIDTMLAKSFGLSTEGLSTEMLMEALINNWPNNTGVKVKDESILFSMDEAVAVYKNVWKKTYVLDKSGVIFRVMDTGEDALEAKRAGFYNMKPSGKTVLLIDDIILTASPSGEVEHHSNLGEVSEIGELFQVDK